MNMIVTVDKNWAIGNKGRSFVSIPENEQMLRADTTGKVVVMSKNVAEHFPGGYSYQDRINVILTKDMNYTKKGAVMVHSLEELLDYVKKYNTESVYVIGGVGIFRQLLPYCDIIDVTYIDYEYEADTHFANLDEDEHFRMTEESDERTYFDLEYVFRRYERNK